MATPSKIAISPQPWAAPINDTGIDVATTSTTILTANTSREWVELSNLSDTSIVIGFGATASATHGIVLAAGQTRGYPYSGALSGLHLGVSGTKRLGVVTF